MGLTTPEGRARRAARRDVAATVPRKLGKGAVYAPAAKLVAVSYKSAAPTVAADSGASVNNAAENSQQQAVRGDGNQLTAQKQDTTQEAMGWKAAVLQPIGQAIGAILIALVGGLAFWLWLHRPRKDDNA